MITSLSNDLDDKADKQLNTFANENIKSSSILTATSQHTMKNFVGVTFSPTIKNRTQNGVTYSQSDNVISISGTPTSGYSINNIIGATSSVPAIFKKGYAYSLQFDSTDSNIYVQISMRKDGVEVYNIHTNISPLNFYVPSDITGLLIRFFIRQGDEVNGTVSNFALYRVFNSFLKSTGDTTDRTEEITTILQTTGVCKLDSGVYYVKNLQMPEGSALYGCGKATIVRLSDDNDAVYAISTNTNTSIYNLCVEGANADITLSDSKNIQRHGIYHSAHYVSPDLTTTRRWVQIENVSISRFTGSGVYNEDTGLPTDAGLCLSNCKIYNCNVGINIPYSGEYNKYTCVDITRCYYGFINNGSSNIFVGGSISSCYIGICVEGDGENTPNIGHCVFSGCTLNHFYGEDATANAGVVLDMTNCMSWTFDACNIAYGAINIETSDGIIFNSCQIGAKADFNINGGRLVLFTGNVSRSSSEPVITITNNSLCKFHNNYARSGPAWAQNT